MSNASTIPALTNEKSTRTEIAGARLARSTAGTHSTAEHLFRFSNVDTTSANDEDMTIQVAFSSEEPVLRKATKNDEKLGIAKEGDKYWEVLSHRKQDADFSELNTGKAAVLDEHDDSKQIGNVKRARLSKDKIGRAVLQLDGMSELSTTRFKQMRSGKRTGISCGYWHTGLVSDDGDKDGYPVKRVAWGCDEITSTRIPADEKHSGVRRSVDGQWSCLGCGGMFDREDLNEDFQCEDCEGDSEGERSKLHSDALVRLRELPAGTGAYLVRAKNGDDRHSHNAVRAAVSTALNHDSRFKAKTSTGDSYASFYVHDIEHDDNGYRAIVMGPSPEYNIMGVDFDYDGEDAICHDCYPVEFKGGYEKKDDGMGRSLERAIYVRSGKEPYGNVEYADPGYQKDKKKRYPINTKEHAKAAWNYINKGKNGDKYSAEDLAKVKSKIKAACKHFGVEISEDRSAHGEDDLKRSNGSGTAAVDLDKNSNGPRVAQQQNFMPKTIAELKTEAPELVAELDKATRTAVTAEITPTITSEARKTEKNNILARNKKITDKTDEFIKDHGMKQRGKLGETLRSIANEFLTRDHGDAADKEVLAEYGQRCLTEIAKVQPEPYLLRSHASDKEYQSYSFMNGIRSIIQRHDSGKGFSRLPDKSFELDVHQDMIERAKECGGLLGAERDGGGFHVPMDAPTPGFRVHRGRDGRIERRSAIGDRFKRDLYTGDFGSGGALVPTELMTPIIEPLRNWTALDKVNTRFLGGLSGNIVIPRQTGVTAPQAVSEIGALVATQPDFDQISAKPRRIGNQTKYSKQLIFQSSPDVEAIIRDDNFKQIALLCDEYGINGSGAGSQPLGVMNQPGIFSIIFGGTATIALIESMATNIRAANIREALALLTTSSTRGRWRSVAAALVNATTVISGQQNAIWTGSDDEGMVTGRPAFDSQQIPANQVIMGAWDNLIWFQWAGVEIVVDPYTQAGTGEWLITLNTYNDFAVRHPQAFCISADAGNQ